jgi:hypothetical protein
MRSPSTGGRRLVAAEPLGSSATARDPPAHRRPSPTDSSAYRSYASCQSASARRATYTHSPRQSESR